MIEIKNIENLLNNKSDNLYVYTRIKLDNTNKFSMNTNSKLDSSIIFQICDFINKLDTENIILVCRSEKEPYTHEHPNKKEIEFIKNKTNKNIKIFFQEPWPEPVPSFIETNTSVIRFGFDEGCMLDMKCVDELFSLQMDMGVYDFLINKNKSIDLNNKRSLI
tara:strand:- start:39 stop:527 length:489 start_codon:yes stop_codon:yes gene_type:complete